jgi:hypothetical protein
MSKKNGNIRVGNFAANAALMARLARERAEKKAEAAKVLPVPADVVQTKENPFARIKRRIDEANRRTGDTAQ